MIRFIVRFLLGVSLLSLLLSGCSWFSSAEEPEVVKDPFAEGILKAIGHLAPPESTTQFLANIADTLGWENEVSKRSLLKIAVTEEEFSEKVEPFLLSLFYAKGFSVLPQIGEGHQFSRDTVVRGGLQDSKFLVTTREKVRIVFLTPVQNVQIIYPKDGTQPQVFAPNPKAVLTIRRSMLDQYIR